jgi:hypothetical protein
MKKVITRVKGGLGNQLFCYAAARRLATVNNAELVIDDVTGFLRDRLYRRKYMLDRFSIPARKATPTERLEPFERYKRVFIKLLSRRKQFKNRQYIEQEGVDFDERLLAINVYDTLYIEGLWQSEGYFKDIEPLIREDLRIVPPTDSLNQRIADKINRDHTAVAVHVRWFDAPNSTERTNISASYYRNAIALMENTISSPHYYLFSDNPEATRQYLVLPDGRATFISHNRGDENAWADLWLMTKCQHFIIANSTFSWWGAWLGGDKEKIVVAPLLEISGKAKAYWGFAGLIPSKWIKV